MRFFQFFDRFIPNAVRSVPKDEFKARVLVVTAFLGGAAGLLGLVALTISLDGFHQSRPILFWIDLFFSLLCFATPWILQKTKSLKIASIPPLCLGAFVAIMGGFQNGGMSAPIIGALLLLPLGAQFFGNSSLRNCSFLGCIAILLSIRVAEHFGWTQPSAVGNSDSIANVRLLVYLLLISVSFGLALVFERSRRETEKRLEQLTRVASIGLVSGGFAHEINSPLTVILFGTSRLQNTLTQPNPDFARLTATVQQIEKAAQKISLVVSSIRASSLEDQSAPKLQNVDDILKFALKFCEDSFQEAGVTFKISGHPQNIQLLCKPTQISQALVNLFQNSLEAIKHSPQKWIEFSAKEDTHFIEFKISDSGPGIPKEARNNLFTPFHTTKEVGQGFGLGLATSASIIHLHNGQIHLDPTTPNTTFTIHLPKP